MEQTAPASVDLAPSAEPGAWELTISGDWLLDGDRPAGRQTAESLAGNGLQRVSAKAGPLGRWDSSLLIFLLEFEDELGRHDIAVDLSQLPGGLTRLIRLARAVPPQQEVLADEADDYGVLTWLGLTTLSARASLGSTLRFLGEVTLSMYRWVRGKAQYRRVDMVLTIQQASIEALGIVTLVCFLLGLILAFVGAIQLQAFGAAIYVADLVGIAMVRDMGALMTAIVMAGRSGAAFAAQLGTMKVNEEIDALTTMGIDSIDFLVLPRIVALVLMMPLLTLYADVVGIIGGLVVGMTMLDLGYTEYLQQTTAAIEVKHLVGGMFKGAVYGGLIALAGTLRGMESGKSAGAVGQAATSAVVTAVVWIIAASGVFAYLFYIFGW